MMTLLCDVLPCVIAQLNKALEIKTWIMFVFASPVNTRSPSEKLFIHTQSIL